MERQQCSPADGCLSCGAEPEGRRTVYCSADCARRFPEDHVYRLGRRLAKRGAAVREGRRVVGYRCRRCEAVSSKVEVNHIRPLAGSRRSVSCLNHRDNLEVLCLGCHRTTTNEQRRGVGP